MIVMTERYQGKLYVLDANGRIWRFDIGYDGQPTIQEIGYLSHDAMRHLDEPKLASHDKSLM
jgi:hypothetical protein